MRRGTVFWRHINSLWATERPHARSQAHLQMQPEIWVQSDLFFSFRYSSKHIENGKINTFYSRKATESKVNSGSASGNDKTTSSSVLSTQRITSCARDIWEAKRDIHPGSSLRWMLKAAVQGAKSRRPVHFYRDHMSFLSCFIFDSRVCWSSVVALLCCEHTHCCSL